MSRPGPKSTPKALKIAQGTRKDRINHSEPESPPGMPECPAHLGTEARNEWSRIAPILESMGVLSPKDGPALAIYCDAYGMWVEASKRLSNGELTVHTAKGGEQTSPYVRIARDSQATMLRVLQEFGCTPSSASAVKVAGKDGDQDDLATFLKGSG